MQDHLSLIPLSVTGLLAALSLGQAALVRNPSFESNFVLPWPYGSSIDEWNGGSGVNDRTIDPGGPFHDNGLTPDRNRVAFKQGTGPLSQTVSGLTPGQRYWVQFHYNTRLGSGGTSGNLDITTSFAGAQIDKITGVQPVGTNNAPFLLRTVPFVAGADTGDLLFQVTAAGDRTALFDAVTIIPRETNDVVVVNPSFEASGTLPSPGVMTNSMAGWMATGTCGVDSAGGAYADNGTVPEQDLVAFIQGPGSLSQPVAHLVVGNTYQIVVACNARSGSVPHLQIKVDAAVLWEGDLTAVGGANAYLLRTNSFIASTNRVTLAFVQTKAGTDTVLLDNVRVTGEAATPLPPLELTPKKAELAPGQTVTAVLRVPQERIALGPVDIKLASSNPNVLSLRGAASNGVVTLHFDPPGAGAPAPITGMRLWLKADAITGVADGAKLASWLDSSGNNTPATNANAANQPVFVLSGRSGKPTVRFNDGSSGGIENTANMAQFLDTDSAVQTKLKPFSAFIVFRSDDTGFTTNAAEGRENLLQPRDGTNPGRTVLFIDTPSGNRRVQSVAGQASLVAAHDYTPGSWTLGGLVQDTNTATLALFLNGSPEVIAPMGAEVGVHAGWRIGASKQGHGGLMGEVAEVIVYDRTLTPSEREQVESYLIGKWGLPGVTAKTLDGLALRRGTANITVTESAGLDVPNAVQVNVVDSFVRNPSFEADSAPSGAGYGPILAWSSPSGAGVNTIGQPFAANSGIIPDGLQVAFVQGVGTLSQTVTGLTPGRNYWLQFRYGQREQFPTNAINLAVRFGGQVLTNITGITSVTSQGLLDYYVGHVPFSPTNSTGLLEFVASAPVGDSSLLLDAVSIVQRDAADLVVHNPSFEASGAMALYAPGLISGWETVGGKGADADGPFADNGIIPDQDMALFIQNAGSVRQVVSGFTAGQKYTLLYSVNERNYDAQGQQPILTHYLAQVGDPTAPVTIFEEDITPVGAGNPYLTRYVVFTATNPDQELRFEHVPPAGKDRSLLLDNVRIVPGEAGPPPVLTVGLQAEGTVRITWPVDAQGFVLQSAPTVAGTWANDAAPVSTEGTVKVVTVPATEAARFYRLIK